MITTKFELFMSVQLTRYLDYDRKTWSPKSGAPTTYQSAEHPGKKIQSQSLMEAAKKLLGAALLAFAVFPAIAALNCEKPIGSAEARICKYQSSNPENDFLALDASLNSAYRRAMEEISEKGKLRAEQRTWILERNKCQDDTCFREKYVRRIRELSEISQQSNSYEGFWERCTFWRGQKICESFSLLQKEKKICGDWVYWASGRFYEGRLTAEQKGDGKAEWLKVCGPHGHRAKTECEDGSNEVWEAAKGGFQLCNGLLHSHEGEESRSSSIACTALESRDAWLRNNFDPVTREKLINRAWVKNCLND